MLKHIAIAIALLQIPLIPAFAQTDPNSENKDFAIERAELFDDVEVEASCPDDCDERHSFTPPSRTINPRHVCNTRDA